MKPYVEAHKNKKEKESVCEWVRVYVCMYTSEGVQGGGRSKPGLILLDFGQTGPVDPDFFGQEPSLDYKDSFEPKSSFLDQMVQKLRDHKGLYVFPFPGLIYRYLEDGVCAHSLYMERVP